jgi:hypothetical protein
MSKETRIYAVIDWSVPTSEPTWNTLMSEGIIESLNTLRKSLDETKVIAKWQTGQTPNIAPEKILWQGSLSEMQQYLLDNISEWESEDIEP